MTDMINIYETNWKYKLIVFKKVLCMQKIHTIKKTLCKYSEEKSARYN